MIKALCLDFDGVLVNSTRECLHVALETYKELNKEKLNDFTETEYKELVKLRPMVRGAQEYLKAIEIVLNRIDVNSYELFSKFPIENFYDKNFINIFRELFYKNRNKLISDDVDYWVGLHDYYFDIFNFIKERLNKNENEKIYIISLKDKFSISTLMRLRGIKNTPYILDFEDINSKPDGLDYLCKKYNFGKHEILFIDDNPLHLNDCISKGYENCYLPSWNKNCLENSDGFNNLKLINIKLIKDKYF